jgi:hypothetical protein
MRGLSRRSPVEDGPAFSQVMTMKTALWIVSLAALAMAQPQAPSSASGLLRVAPTPQAGLRARLAPEPVDPEPFDAAQWRERLSQADLDARLFSFEQLAQRARGDAEVRRQIDEWASAGDDREFAWTARLLQRELARDLGRDSAHASHAPRIGLWRIDPFSEEPFAELERRMDEWMRSAPHGGLGLWGAPGTWDASRSDSAQVEITPEGVKVRITEDVDGEVETREYTAATLEELLEAHPELREQLNVSGRSSPGALPSLPQLEWFFGAPRAPQALPAPGGVQGVRTDVLGVLLDELSADERKQLALENGVGLRISRVEPGTIAERLRLKRGQVLLELDGEPVRSRDDVTRRIRARAKDAEVRASVLDRWGQRHETRWLPEAGD